MIRDPSDGTVRDGLGKNTLGQCGPCESATLKVSDLPVIDTATSGLQTGSSKPENIARLDKSRECLKNYQQRSASNPRTEGSHGTEG
jgi:hypothetical protein